MEQHLVVTGTTTEIEEPATTGTTQAEVTTAVEEDHVEAETGHVEEKTGRTDEVETGVNTGREEREENGVREEVIVGVEEVVLHEEAAVTEEAITTVVLPGEVQVEGEVGAAPPDPRILNVPPPSCPEML